MKMRPSFSTLALSAAALVGIGACGDDSSPNPHPTPETPDDATYSAGPFTVEAGKELVMCTYVRGTNDAEADITSLHAKQSEGGHHLIVYTIDHAVDLAPHLCSQGGQPGWSQLLATQIKEETVEFPEGVGFHVKAHQQYVLETHYINTTGAALEVDSSFGTTLADAGTVTTRAATYFFGSMNIDVGPNETATTTATCKVPTAMGLHTMFGHEHRMGVGVDVARVAGDGTRSAVYSTTAWEAPPITSFDPGLSLDETDSVEVRCDWDNTSSTRLRYPHEMCFAIGYYWPAESALLCTSGGQKDDCTCQAQGATDTGPGGATVEVHLQRAAEIANVVGEVDTGAPIYCALYRKDDWSGVLPKEGAQPYFFRDAIDQPLTTPDDEIQIDIQDVTPGDYVVTCLMDTIGGGFKPGTGDAVNIVAVPVSVAEGATATAEVELDFAVP